MTGTLSLTARDELIKIAYQHPALRPQLLPVIIKTAGLEYILASDKEGMQSGTAKGIATWVAIAAIAGSALGAVKIFGPSGKDEGSVKNVPVQVLNKIDIQIDGKPLDAALGEKPSVKDVEKLKEVKENPGKHHIEYRFRGTVIGEADDDGNVEMNEKGMELLKGEKGDKGDAGEKGDKGDRGQKGDSRNITLNVQHADTSTVNAPGPSH